MLPCVCSVINHRGRQNVVRTSLHLAITLCSTFLFLPHFDVICDLLLNRRTATWNLFIYLWKVWENEMMLFYDKEGLRHSRNVQNELLFPIEERVLFSDKARYN